MVLAWPWGTRPWPVLGVQLTGLGLEGWGLGLGLEGWSLGLGLEGWGLGLGLEGWGLGLGTCGLVNITSDLQKSWAQHFVQALSRTRKIIFRLWGP